MPTTMAVPRHRTVRDVMTDRVVTVPAAATFREMSALFTEYGVGALPVLDAGGGLVGIVAEVDLLFKQEAHEPGAPRPPRRPREHASKAEGRCARDVMTTSVVTVNPGAGLPAAARLMHRNHVKSLPVVDEYGVLVGIVSRRDLLSVYQRSDDDLRADVADLVSGWLGVEPAGLGIAVDDGVVTLEGDVDRRSDAEALPHLVAGLDGVVDVHASLTYRLDDRLVAHASGPAVTPPRPPLRW